MSFNTRNKHTNDFSVDEMVKGVIVYNERFCGRNNDKVFKIVERYILEYLFNDFNNEDGVSTYPLIGYYLKSKTKIKSIHDIITIILQSVIKKYQIYMLLVCLI